MTREWTIGKTFVVRHAGLPFDWVEQLGAGQELLTAADQLLDEEARLLAAAPSAVLAAAARRAVTAVDPDRLRPSADPRWASAIAAWAAAVDDFRKAFEVADEDATQALRNILNRVEVQEAVFLSNPDVYRNMVVPFLGAHHRLNSRWRRVRRQLYTYVQRLCAKNETVSFFGPMAYGTAGPGAGLSVRSDVPRRRRVFMAYWAATALAAAIVADRRLRPLLPLRRTGATLPADLPSALAGLLDDPVSLARIATGSGVGLREAALQVQPLVAGGYLQFDVEPAPYDLDPLDHILTCLGGLATDAALPWTERISELRDLLGRLQGATFPDRIDLVDRLEQAFSAATGRAARRGAGAVYADRAIWYEECASPFAVTIGEQTLNAWARQLTAALELSTAHGAATQAASTQRVRDALGSQQRLSLIAYGELLRDVFDPGGSRFVPDHVTSYPAPPAGSDDAGHPADDLLAAARALSGDRYVLIDLCPTGGIPSAGGEPTAPGELVLSRCHHHLLTDGWLATMYCGEAPFDADARDWVGRQPQLVALDVGRRNKGYYRFPGRRVALRRPAAADAGDPGVLTPEKITVDNGPAGLRCLDPAGHSVEVYLPLSDYVKYPPYAALSHPQVLHAVFEGDDATPAVTVAGVVYQRPRWRVDGKDLALPGPQARFLQLRRLARQRVHGRFVFCRTAGERKPYLVDLASVLAADLIAHVAGEGGPVTVEQMAPAPEQLWLRDPEGRRYTSELRMQVIGTEVTR